MHTFMAFEHELVTWHETQYTGCLLGNYKIWHAITTPDLFKYDCDCYVYSFTTVLFCEEFATTYLAK